MDPISQARLDANRANAQKGTGPTTPEGKAASSRNAVKHGFTALVPIVSQDDYPEFVALHSRLKAELKPVGDCEMHLYREIVLAMWNIHRIHLERREIMSHCMQTPSHCTRPDAQAMYDRLERYNTRHERTLHRSMKLLKELQNERLQRSITPEAIPDEAPLLVDSVRISKRNHQWKQMSQKAPDPAPQPTAAHPNHQPTTQTGGQMAA